MKFGYELTMIDGVEMIAFDDRFKVGEPAFNQPMNYDEFKESFKAKGYTVKKEGDLYYKYLNGDRSGIEYENEEDAYIDCYIHASENETKIF